MFHSTTAGVEMKHLFSIALAALAASGTAIAEPVRFAATCSGSETVKVGDQPLKTLPYALAFSADLQRRLYCYDRCKREDTYSIADGSADPVRLADFALAGEMRRLT